IDYFKMYNDHYGHQAGDNALFTVAEAFRTSVSRKSDLAARYGGEEFALVLPDTNLAGAQLAAERLQQKIKRAAIPHQYSEVDSVITISIGIATLIPSAENDPAFLIRNSDIALYKAKDEGRNRVVCYDPSMR
ncbi:MAG: diguanylate cyclase, partial [Pseudomonadales bacterium]